MLGTDRPFITDIDVARYCERHSYASLEDPETGHGLLQEAATNRRVELKFRLRELLGDGRLFTSLVVASWPDPELEFDENGEEIETGPLADPLAEDAFDRHIADATSDLSNAEAYERRCGRGFLICLSTAFVELHRRPPASAMNCIDPVVMNRTMMKTPREVFDDYNSGAISRSEMITTIAEYPFAPRPPTDGYDWLTPAADGPTWSEVTRAKRHEQITSDDYAAIFDLRNSRRR